MKVGTDGVLLGSWADISNASQILDIGTGTGVIAIMLAQRAPKAKITAIDIEPNAYEQARENIAQSLWKDRMFIRNEDFNALANRKEEFFDLVVCNPPYFSNSLKSPSEQRNLARHEGVLTHQELLTGVKKILCDTGRFSVVLPYFEGVSFTNLAKKAGFFCSKKMNISTKQGTPIKRLLLEFQLSRQPLVEQFMYIREDGDNEFSSEYKELTKGFYLNF